MSMVGMKPLIERMDNATTLKSVKVFMVFDGQRNRFRTLVMGRVGDGIASRKPTYGGHLFDEMFAVPEGKAFGK
jgi:hypothetical protein